LVVAVAFGQTLNQADHCHVSTGPVVRITPNEVHLSDPENYEMIYRVGTKYWKDPGFYGAFGLDTTGFGAISNELHRVRRAVLNPCFSRKAVLELEGIVHAKVQKLCDQMADAFQGHRPVDLHHGFRAVSVDVITDYAIDNCYNLLDKPGFGIDYFDLMSTLVKRTPLFVLFPLIQSVAMKTPAWLVKKLSARIGAFIQMQEVTVTKFEINSPGLLSLSFVGF
jgi:cytochrome P450